MIRAALLALVLFAAPLWAAQPPHRVQIDFTVTSGSMRLGEGRDVLEHDGKRYSVISESRTVGIAAFFYKMNIRRESRGLLLKNELRPLHFEESRTRKPLRAADFDWESRLIRLTDGEENETLPLPENTYDQTSFAYRFAFIPLNVDAMVVHLTDGRRLTEYKYQIIGKEKLATPLGELETLHFQKVREGDDKRGLEVWLAVDHHHLPVRIRYVEKNGTVVDSTVTSISYP